MVPRTPGKFARCVSVSWFTKAANNQLIYCFSTRAGQFKRWKRGPGCFWGFRDLSNLPFCSMYVYRRASYGLEYMNANIGLNRLYPAFFPENTTWLYWTS